MMSLSRPCWVMVNNRLSCLGCQEKELTIWEFRTEKAKTGTELTLRVQDWKIKNRYWAHTESSGLKNQKPVLSSHWEFRTEKSKTGTDRAHTESSGLKKQKPVLSSRSESSGLKNQKPILSSWSESSGLKNPNPHYLRVQNWKSKQTQSEWSQLKNQKPVLSSQSEYSRQKNQNQHILSHN